MIPQSFFKSADVFVFDLDDTLYLERDFALSGFRYVGERLRVQEGLSGFAEACWTLFLQGARGRIFNAALVQLDRPDLDPQVKDWIDWYRYHEPSIELLPDSVMLLEKIRERETRTGLITDGPSQMQWNKIRALGLQATLDFICPTSDLGEGFGKPSPRAFEETQNFFGECSEHYIYFADNPAKDFIAPRKIGWRSIRIRREHGVYSDLESDGENRPDYEIADLAELNL